MPRIRFGSSGIPHSAKHLDTVEGIRTIKALGLDSMELSFTHGVHMGREAAEAIGRAREETGLTLSIHGPYYINLFALEKQKIVASQQRLRDCLRVGEWAGCDYVCFHPAYYMKAEPKTVYRQVLDLLTEMVGELKDQKMRIRLAPETTGRATQFGSLEETLEMAREQKELLPVFDFCHLHARDNGRFRRKEDVAKVLETIKATAPWLLKDFRMQVSGVKYSEKGERAHLPLNESDFPYKWLLECLKEFKVEGTIICESPQLEFDAILMRDYYNGLD